jgi:hypothetical protein
MPTRINLPCDGDGGKHSVAKIKDTITFGTSGNCTFTSFQFDGYAPPKFPQGFSNPQPPSGVGPTISYNYDGTPMPANGYPFTYKTTPKTILGNGTGVIKN